MLTIEQLKHDNNVRIWCRHIIPWNSLQYICADCVFLFVCILLAPIFLSFLFLNTYKYVHWKKPILCWNPSIFQRLLSKKTARRSCAPNSVWLFLFLFRWNATSATTYYGNTIPNNWIWKWILLHQTRDFVAATISGLFSFFGVCVCVTFTLSDILSFNSNQCNWQ